MSSCLVRSRSMPSPWWQESGRSRVGPRLPRRHRRIRLMGDRRHGPSRRRMWVVAVVILAAIGFLLFKGLTSAIVFFKTANEAVAQRATLGNSDFQLEGTVVHGSVRHVSGN